MSSEAWAETLILIGVLFDLLGTIGLVRLPDVYNRLQAGTKCVTLGTCFILAGAAVWAGGALAMKAVICMAFVLLTSPVGAHALARSAYRSGVAAWEGTVVDDYRGHVERLMHAPTPMKDEATALAQTEIA
ncbi:Na+/H+ antiporter subunit G [bacterium]|nr:Na+/H+ antiporter subunit G [bacterium]